MGYTLGFVSFLFIYDGSAVFYLNETFVQVLNSFFLIPLRRLTVYQNTHVTLPSRAIAPSVQLQLQTPTPSPHLSSPPSPSDVSTLFSLSLSLSVDWARENTTIYSIACSFFKALLLVGCLPALCSSFLRPPRCLCPSLLFQLHWQASWLLCFLFFFLFGFV